MSVSLKARISALERMTPRRYRLVEFSDTAEAALEGMKIEENDVIIMIKSPLIEADKITAGNSNG